MIVNTASGIALVGAPSLRSFALAPKPGLRGSAKPFDVNSRERAFTHSRQSCCATLGSPSFAGSEKPGIANPLASPRRVGHPWRHEKVMRRGMAFCPAVRYAPAAVQPGRRQMDRSGRTTRRIGLARRPPGFVLLEVLVAFAIAALALSAFCEAALSGLRAAQQAGRYELALSHARSRLAAIGHGIALTAGTQQGDDGGGFTWHAQIEPVAFAPIARGEEAATRRGPRIALYAVGIAISWNDGRRKRDVRLITERVGAAPPATP